MTLIHETIARHLYFDSLVRVGTWAPDSNSLALPNRILSIERILALKQPWLYLVLQLLSGFLYDTFQYSTNALTQYLVRGSPTFLSYRVLRLSCLRVFLSFVSLRSYLLSKTPICISFVTPRLSPSIHYIREIRKHRIENKNSKYENQTKY